MEARYLAVLPNQDHAPKCFSGRAPSGRPTVPEDAILADLSLDIRCGLTGIEVGGIFFRLSMWVPISGREVGFSGNNPQSKALASWPTAKKSAVSYASKINEANEEENCRKANKC
jgi:hypothetical protein